jgi:hypothetical protein
VDSADRDFELPSGQQYGEFPQLLAVGVDVDVGESTPAAPA